MPRSSPPYPLAQLQKRGFDASIRARGAAYFHERLVSPPQWEGSGARLSVRGTREYVVVVDWSDWQATGLIDATCDCPYAREGYGCKHIWAAFLALDQSTEKGPAPQAVLSGTSDWLHQIRQIQEDSQKRSRIRPGENDSPSRMAIYLLDLEATRKAGTFVVELFRTTHEDRARKRPIRHQLRELREVRQFADPLDREILAILFSLYSPHHTKAEIPAELAREILPRMIQTQRFHLSRKDQEEGRSLAFQSSPEWRLEMEAREALHSRGSRDTGDELELKGFIRAGESAVPIGEPILLLESGWVLFRDRIAYLAEGTPFGWIRALRKPIPIRIPRAEVDQLIATLAEDPHAPPIHWPDSLQWRTESAKPTPGMLISAPKAWERPDSGFEAKVFWDYRDRRIPGQHVSAVITDPKAKMFLKRDPAEEALRLAEAESIIGARATAATSTRIPSTDFGRIAAELLERGWILEAEGRKLRPAQVPQIEVRSGIDWFEVQAKYSADVSGLPTGMPELLEAIRNKSGWVPLGDGSVALLPETWARKWGALAAMAGTSGDEPAPLRFSRGQGLLLHAALQGGDTDDLAPKTDSEFRALGENLLALTRLPERKPSRRFQGELRAYQRTGLGWLHSLRALGLGGILADDMGLGKTVQILAHLEHAIRDRAADERLPSLIVVPKSLLYNWEAESARFTPHLRVLRYAGSARERAALRPHFAESDIILLTYATLRSDIEALRARSYDTVIIDEAQAIKNPRSQAHQAALMLQARQRLALTGTPIENSIADLFSLLDFTNPGLVSPTLRERFGASGSLEPEAMSLLSRALKPVILRRTKEQVLQDLPAKVEQTLFCELSTSERRRYEELRSHFRSSLKEQIERNGFGRSKILVLEALLRLRQMACHPGMIQKNLETEESAKTQALLAQLKELRAEGHKALVFSQFTRFLDIVGKHLNSEGIPFEYLDGSLSSGARETAIERFKSDPDASVFLISLKAGGVGLNLTEAGYVFVLDPWWNPAVEAQAIGRAYRIGQTRKVIAYRIIAKDTIEEKILELQKSKQTLADAVITADAGMLRTLTLKDLEILLG